MKLSERDEDLQLLDRLYAGCVDGKGAAVLVDGPVGCGKTALLRAFAERVFDQGGLFFSVTASASERLHPFGLVDLLMNAMRAAGMAGDLLVAEEIGATVPGGVGQGLRRAAPGLLQRICRVICEFAEEKPLVISIDDVHFADDPSLECLRFLIRRIDSSAIMILMSESSCRERELATFHADTLHLPYCYRIRLAPLTATGVTGQLTERLGADAARRLADLAGRATGGNPLLLRALIDDATAADAAGVEPNPGEGFRRAYLRCLHRCEPTMRAVARAVAVLGETASPALVGDFLVTDVTSVRRSIVDLNIAGLLSAERFRHEAAQLAVLVDIPFKDLPEMHSRAAELLHESGAAAVAVAGQLMAAHHSVKPSWRVAILREAAHEAMASGDVAESVNYLRHAFGICADAAQEAQITAALADAQWHIDPAKAARHLQHLSYDVRAGLLTGKDALVPVKQLLWWGDFVEADDLLKVIEGSEAAPGDASPPYAASSELSTVRSWLSFCCPALADDAADCTTALTLLDTTASQAIDGADRVPHGAPAGRPVAPTLFALISLILTDRLAEAASWARRLVDEPSIGRVPMRRALVETIRSAVALRQGAVADAGEYAQAALVAVAPPAWGVVVGIPLSLAVRAATELGDFDAAKSYLNLAVPPIMFDTPFALPYLQALGRYHLAMGRPHTALTSLTSCGDLMVRWGLDSPALADWRSDAAAALVAMGKVQRARALIEEQLSRLGDGRSRVHGVTLRLLAATSAVPDRVPLLDEAVLILKECGDELELAHARADLETAREALSSHDPKTHSWTLPSDEDDGPELPGPPPLLPGQEAEEPDADGSEAAPVLAELTDAQRRVVELAASGWTNRQIARRLFITVSTVEQHLTKVYRKLNVRRRSDLPRN
jgi:DNA-binding CsgD family transcriptional regulator